MTLQHTLASFDQFLLTNINFSSFFYYKWHAYSQIGENFTKEKIFFVSIWNLKSLTSPYLKSQQLGTWFHVSFTVLKGIWYLWIFFFFQLTSSFEGLLVLATISKTSNYYFHLFCKFQKTLYPKSPNYYFYLFCNQRTFYPWTMVANVNKILRA